MSKDVIFHCAMPIFDNNGDVVVNDAGKIEKETATHTLVFRRVENEKKILMGWARAHQMDMYNKKVGLQIATDRINTLETRFKDHPNRGVSVVDVVTPKHLPIVIIRNSLDFYIDKAVKSLFTVDEIEDGGNISLIFRSYLKEVPVCSVNIDVATDVW